MTCSFKLNFRVNHPYLKDERFEERLALRLLDILVGRDGKCIPDPVPFNDPRNPYTRIIGSGNNFWLHKDPDNPSKFTVQARYDIPETAAIMQAAQTIIRLEYRNCLEPEQAPTQTPSSAFKPG